MRFVHVASRYEEDVFGQTTIGFPTAGYADCPAEKQRLGSGAFFTDEGACSKELAVNAARVEAWRRTECYKLFQEVRGVLDVSVSVPHNWRVGCDELFHVITLRVICGISPSTKPRNTQ